MKKTIFKIHKREDPFVQIDRNAINNKKLSWRAKGLLTFLLSKPENWKVYIKNIAESSTDGRTSTSSGIDELINNNYVYRFKRRNKKGRFMGYLYLVFEVPKSEKEAYNILKENNNIKIKKNKSDTEIREADSGKVETNNKDISNKEKLSKDNLEKSTDSSKSKEEYGNNIINFFIEALKKFQNISTLDDSTKWNRRYAYNLIKHKIEKEFENSKLKPTDKNIKKFYTNFLKGLNKNPIHKQNATSMKYLYQHFNQIMKL